MHKARKQFGQHFLTDQNILDKIIRSINPKPGDRIIEIGPGQGAMTDLVLQHIRTMEVIEIDYDLAELLTLRHPSRLTIHRQDILKFDFNILKAQPSSLRIIGNLPYNISTPILFLLLKNMNLIIDMHLMLQKEVVDRMVASPGNKIYGRLSVMLQPYFKMESLFNIAPAAFSPPPKVNSSFVRITPRKIPLAEIINHGHYEEIVRAAFSQRRKTLRNTVKNFLSNDEIASLDIDPQLRPEVLEVAQFARLANCYTKKISK